MFFCDLAAYEIGTWVAIPLGRPFIRLQWYPMHRTHQSTWLVIVIGIALATLSFLGCTERSGRASDDLPSLDGAFDDVMCADGVRNGSETSTDCGGDCLPCDDGMGCVLPTDCQSNVCRGRFCLVASCSDGIQNGAETSDDCGGPTCDGCVGGKPCTDGTDCLSDECTDGACEASSCEDGVMNDDETGIDCGGPTCSTCAE